MGAFYYHRLLSEPLVAVVVSGKDELWPGIEYVARVAGGRPANVFVQQSWHLPKHLPHMLDAFKRGKGEFPSMCFTILANDQDALSLAGEADLDAILCNNNAFTDERLFYPEPGIPKLYDAVHNGRLVPFKRHELAADVPRLAVLARGFETDQHYAATSLAGIHDLAFSNYRPVTGVQRTLDAEQVRRVLVQSRCGLCLSAEEGSNFASVEYMLAGLPVVSTSSRGGRDAFFHRDYVAMVDPTANAVAAAVSDFKQRQLDPFVIRNRTLALFREHRRRLIDRLSAIAGFDFLQLADGSMWLPQFGHQLRRRMTFTG